MRKLYLAGALCTALAASTVPSKAFVGELDTANKYPYVVRILGASVLCTGTAINRRVVLTAGHCVWKDKKYIENLRIEYRFADGTIRKVRAMSLSVTDEYKSASEAVAGIDDENPLLKELLSEQQRRMIWSRSMTNDVGFIIAESDITLTEYARTVLDESLPFVAKLRPLVTSKWTKELSATLNAPIMSEWYARFDRNAIHVSGVGIYHCGNYEDRNTKQPTCKQDGQFRYGILPAGTLIRTETGIDQQSYLHWTGRNTANINPVRRGDSGGPLLIEDSTTKRLVQFGVVSRAGPDNTHYASLIENAGVWFRFFDSAEYKMAMGLSTSVSLNTADPKGGAPFGYAATDYAFQVCNDSKWVAHLALAWFSVSENVWKVGGWWKVESKTCFDFARLPLNKPVYGFATTTENRTWPGTIPICVDTAKFTRNHGVGVACQPSMLKKFREMKNDEGQPTVTWRLGD